MITIIDSLGNTGGVPQPIYTVNGKGLIMYDWIVVDSLTAGTDTSCLPNKQSSASLPTIQANVTNTLDTCEPWGLHVTGGQKPYTIVLVETHSDTVTKVTLGSEDDTLTYVNRADPNWHLMGE